MQWQLYLIRKTDAPPYTAAGDGPCPSEGTKIQVKVNGAVVLARVLNIIVEKSFRGIDIAYVTAKEL
jgi:hypothetical protein